MSEYVWGKNPVLEVLRSSRTIQEILLSDQLHATSALEEVRHYAKTNNIQIRYLPYAALDRIAHGGIHQGYMAAVAKRRFATLDEILTYAKNKHEDPFLLILDAIQDVHNLGSLLRTAEATGVHGIILPQHNAATISADVTKTSAGATEHLLITQQTNLTQTIEWLKEQNIWIIGLSEHANMLYTEAPLTGGIAIVVGNEGKGLSRLVREHCDFLLRLPMQGHIQCLNAAVAGSILLYEAVRQRTSEKAPAHD